jgi:hypothetical protein
MKIYRLFLATFLLIFILSCTTMKNTTPTAEVKNDVLAKPKTDSLLQNLLAKYPQYFDSVLKNNGHWQVQIIYTQIDRTATNEPVLRHLYYNINPDQYFYPASTVKMPAAFLALEKLNTLNLPGLYRNTTMITGAEGAGQTAVYNDPTKEDGRPTIAHYIKKIFLVSDNDAYNRLYEFLGQEHLNQRLHAMGFDSVQLLHRLQISLNEAQNRTTNPVRFFDSSGKLVYEQPQLKSNLSYQPRQTFLGKGYMSAGKLVNQPFEFSQKNRFSLPDLHSVLQAVIFPESVPAKQRFNLTSDDYRFLYTCMSMLPREAAFPQYGAGYPDGYVKFLIYGGDGPVTNPALRIFNKVGDAYGFLQDVAYIADFEKGIEFMLSVSINCNSNGIYNDNKYDYDTVGFPFLKHLGEVLYTYELQRTRLNKPDLSRFKVDYNHPD